MKKTALILSLILVSLVSCKKEQQGVPYAYVNLNIYVNDPQNIQLTTIGGWKYFSGGYGGLLVYRKSSAEFMVYDRACPVNPDETSTKLVVDSSNIIVKDPSCSSQFLISDGSTIGGPAVVPMQRYNNVFDGSLLRITN